MTTLEDLTAAPAESTITLNSMTWTKRVDGAWYADDIPYSTSLFTSSLDRLTLNQPEQPEQPWHYAIDIPEGLRLTAMFDQRNTSATVYPSVRHGENVLCVVDHGWAISDAAAARDSIPPSLVDRQGWWVGERTLRDNGLWVEPPGETAPGETAPGHTVAVGQIYRTPQWVRGVVEVDGDTALVWQVNVDGNNRIWAGLPSVPVTDLTPETLRRLGYPGLPELYGVVHHLAMQVHDADQFRDRVTAEMQLRHREGSMTGDEIRDFLVTEDLPLPTEEVRVEVHVDGHITRDVDVAEAERLVGDTGLDEVHGFEFTTSFCHRMTLTYTVEAETCACDLVAREQIAGALPTGSSFDEWETSCPYC